MVFLRKKGLKCWKSGKKRVFYLFWVKMKNKICFFRLLMIVMCWIWISLLRSWYGRRGGGISMIFFLIRLYLKKCYGLIFCSGDSNKIIVVFYFF